jgi:hypothetical protein
MLALALVDGKELLWEEDMAFLMEMCLESQTVDKLADQMDNWMENYKE